MPAVLPTNRPVGHFYFPDFLTDETSSGYLGRGLGGIFAGDGMTGGGVLVLTSAVVAVAGSVPELALACALAAVVGFTTSFAGITTQTLMQMATDDAHRGRVMGFWTVVSFGAPSLGAMAIGALGDAFGVAPGLAMIGLAGLAATAALALGFRAGRRHSARASRQDQGGSRHPM